MASCRSDVAGIIKDTLSMDDVARQYGFEPNRGGFISCPFHAEKTPSLKIYTEPGRGWHCYGCGEGGTVIDFVMQLFHIRFSAAVVRLNADFHLGLTADKPDRVELERLKTERAEKKRKQERWESEYMAKVYEHRRLHHAYIHSDPESAEYAEACHRLPALEQWFEEHPYTETR